MGLSKKWHDFIKRITGSNDQPSVGVRVAAYQHDYENGYTPDSSQTRSSGPVPDGTRLGSGRSYGSRGSGNPSFFGSLVDELIGNYDDSNKEAARNIWSKGLGSIFRDNLGDLSNNSTVIDTEPSVDVGPFTTESGVNVYPNIDVGTVTTDASTPLLSEFGSSVLPSVGGSGTSQSVISDAVPSAGSVAIDTVDSAASASSSSSNMSWLGNLLGAGAAGLIGLWRDRTNYDRQRNDYLADRAHLEQREDSAIQRGVADAIAAGINPNGIYGDLQGGSQSAPMDPYDSNDVFKNALDTAMSIQDYRKDMANMDSLALQNEKAKQDLSLYNLRVVDIYSELAQKKINIERSIEALKGEKYDNDVLKPLYAASERVDVSLKELERDNFERRLEHDLESPIKRNYEYLREVLGEKTAKKIINTADGRLFSQILSSVGVGTAAAVGIGKLFRGAKSVPLFGNKLSMDLYKDDYTRMYGSSSTW